MNIASKGISTIVGTIVLGLAAAGSILVLTAYQPDEDVYYLSIQSTRHKKNLKPKTACQVDKVCAGPTVAAEDPEGERVTYKFYDAKTNQLVSDPITANSGKPVTPKFNFTKPGQQQLYMVVEDGSGHTSANYPIIVPVQ